MLHGNYFIKASVEWYGIVDLGMIYADANTGGRDEGLMQEPAGHCIAPPVYGKRAPLLAWESGCRPICRSRLEVSLIISYDCR